MKVKEVIKKAVNVADIEVYRWKGKRHELHTDFIDPVDDDYENNKVYDYTVMNEEEYESTILANSCEEADFEVWYGDKDAKVLIIIVE